MREVDWLDKENGTRNGLLVPQMSDTDRNIMRELQHEPCEWHCNDCGACMTEDDEKFYLPNDDDEYCDDCSLHYYQQKLKEQS